MPPAAAIFSTSALSVRKKGRAFLLGFSARGGAVNFFTIVQPLFLSYNSKNFQKILMVMSVISIKKCGHIIIYKKCLFLYVVIKLVLACIMVIVFPVHILGSYAF